MGCTLLGGLHGACPFCRRPLGLLRSVEVCRVAGNSHWPGSAVCGSSSLASEHARDFEPCVRTLNEFATRGLPMDGCAAAVPPSYKFAGIPGGFSALSMALQEGRHFVCQIFFHKDLEGLEESILYLLKCQEGRCPDLSTDRYVRFKLRVVRNAAADAGLEHSVVLSGGLRLHAVHAADSVHIYFSWCGPIVWAPAGQEGPLRKRARDGDSPERVRQEAALEDSVEMLHSNFSLGAHSRAWSEVADNGAVVARWLSE